MRQIIHNIRKQSETTRRHILHGLTFVFGLVLLSLWVYSLGTNLSNKDTQVKLSNDLKPLSALKGNLIGGYQNITNSDN